MKKIEKIYYIQKEEFQLGTKTVYSPFFYTNYKLAKSEFEKLIEIEKSNLEYLEEETKALDCVMLKGIDEWGETEIEIYLRHGEVDELIKK